MTSRRLLVTGGCGFIGSNFVRVALSALPGAHVRVLDALTYAGRRENLDRNSAGDERVEFIHGSVTDSDVVDASVAWADQIVHIAAESHVDYSARDARVFVETNVMGTATLLEALLRHRAERFIYISSSEVYGTALRIPMDEGHPLLPASPYAGSKAAADRLVYSFVQTHDLPAVIVRPFNNYGPWQHVEKLIPRFITNALDGQPLIVHDEGNQTRDFVHVDDHCAALVASLERPLDALRGNVINIGTGTETTVLSVARAVARLAGLPESMIHTGAGRHGQVWRHCSSTDEARKLLDWSPRTGFSDGLATTFAWYRDNEPWWRSLKPSLALV